MRIKIFAKIFLFLILSLFLGGLVYFYSIIKELPPLNEILTIHPKQSTKIYDRTGKILLYEINKGEKRTIAHSEEIPDYLKKATVAIEDEKFYFHKGIDYRAIIRALYKNIIYGDIVQGGSTITQQLVKNTFVGSKKNIRRKIKEIILSIELEKHYSKDEILTAYLNQVCYGTNIYGVKKASQVYFNKPVSHLTLQESALLAAIPKAPTYYSPWGEHLDELIIRKNFILKKMYKCKFIDEEELQRALSAKIEIEPQQETIKAPHFVMEVKNYLQKKYGKQLIEIGGLTVVTTLDFSLQEIAQEAVKEGALRNEKLYQGKNAALIVENPNDGQILTMVGSRDYFDKNIEGKFNVVTQGLRQPGSTIKPFVYLSAFKKGYCPESIVFDVETDFETPQGIYRPENFDHIFRGPVSLKQALACSINIPSVKIGYLVGLKTILQTLKKFGFTTIKDASNYGPSLALGSCEVKLIDLVKAYSVLATDGVKRKQHLILEVKDSQGKILEKYQDKKEIVEDKQYIRLINNILSDHNLRRPLFGRSLGLTIFKDVQLGLKTGTSNDYRDAWAIGYTPNLVVGVWAGNNDFSPMEKKGSSVLAAVPILHSFLQKILNKIPKTTFLKPDPCFTNKPILRGKYIVKLKDNKGKEYPQIHNILYWVDKDQPLGNIPKEKNDPQFKNWEKGVIDWAEKNIQNFREIYNIIPPQQSQLKNNGQINISGINIKNGQFLNLPFEFKFNIQSKTPLTKIELYLNQNLINQKNLKNSPYNYKYEFQIRNGLKIQNLVKIRVFDNIGNIKEKELIVYKQKQD